MPFKKPGLTINPTADRTIMNHTVDPNIESYLLNRSNVDGESREKTRFDETKKFIIDQMNACKGYTFETEINRINTLIDDMEKEPTDDTIINTLIDDMEKDPTDDTIICSSKNRKGRELSSGCIYATALYYNCNETGTGVKTYTFKKIDARTPDDAPYKSGDRPKYEEQHYTNCKYKIAREIMLQIYANAVSKLSDGLFYVPEIKSFGIFSNTDEKSVDDAEVDDAEVDDAEVVNEKTYFIKMEHIEGETLPELHKYPDKLAVLRETVYYLYNDFNIQHGDIKGDNIIWNENKPTLIDWGEAICDKSVDLKEWDRKINLKDILYSSADGGGHVRQKRKTQKNKKRKSQKSKKRKSQKSKKRKSHKNKKRKSHKKG